jgi:DNA polymerase-1
MTAYEDIAGTGKNARTLDQIDPQLVADYACADADITFMLYEVMLTQLQEHKLHTLFFSVDMPLLPVLARMETTGIAVDMQYLKELGGNFGKRLIALAQDIYGEAGEEFNIRSTRQLGVILFEKLKLPRMRRTKTGYSTDDDVLRELSQHRLPRLIREYREIQKLKSTYIDAVIAAGDSARIHTSFNQAVTATGRLSSTDPNLQNIPIRTETGRMIRRAFVPEHGMQFVSADYSQIDLRVLAHMSRDPAMVETFLNNGDIHRATAADVYGVPIDGVTTEMRSSAKAINFGIVYGQQAFGLSQSLGISRGEAQAFIDQYFVKYAGVKQWIDRTLEQAAISGFVSTILGRIRYVPELTSKQPRMRSFGERVAMNTPIQGSAADIIKVAMINIDRILRERQLQSRMLVQVHDDLLFEVPDDELELVKELARDNMEHAVELDVPLVVDIKAGYNWKDLVNVS